MVHNDPNDWNATMKYRWDVNTNNVFKHIKPFSISLDDETIDVIILAKLDWRNYYF